MNQENNQQEESCPCCESADKAINNLEPGKGQTIKNKSFLVKTGIGLLTLSVVLGILAFDKSRPKSSSSSTNFQFSLPRDQVLEIKLPLEESAGIKIDSLAPDFISEDVWGNKISLSDFRNKKPVLLVFWATWCGYCAKEKEDLKTFTQKYQNEIQVLAVDSSEPRAIIQDYIEKQDINFLMLLDENRKIWNQYLIRGTPSHFLIDKDGKIITMRPGLASLTDLETMLTRLK